MRHDGSLAWRLPNLLRLIDYPGLSFGRKTVTEREYGDPLYYSRYFIRVECPSGVCNVTGKSDPWNGRWWRLSPHMTDGEIVQTAFKAVLTALEHEARERFTYKGVSVFDPHYDIEALVELRKSPSGGLKERDHA